MINKHTVKILIIDDEQSSRIAATMILDNIFRKLSSTYDYSVIEASSLNMGIEKLQTEAFHIIILDKDLGEDTQGNAIKGTNHIKQLLSLRPLAQLLVMTADPSPVEIGQAIKDGAADYLFKGHEPRISEYREAIILRSLQKAIDDLDEATSKLRPVDTSLYGEFVASSPAMLKLKQTCEAYAESNRPVLILGATGLGKGAAARFLNKARGKYLNQNKRLFLNINIGGISEETAQSEIFGHMPNSFTGAGNRVKQGFLELGTDGDIFLDEIGDASPEIQLKLLKVIEERKFTRLGGSEELKTNARFIFATNKDLASLVKQGKFRADLLARISTLEIEMPALEQRKEDLPLLIKYLIERINVENTERKLLFNSFSEPLVEYLSRDNIEGNIRGIENALVRLALGCPKSKTGYVDTDYWEDVLMPRKVTPKKNTIVLTVDLLKNAPTALLGKDFPGLKKVRDILERRLLEEALPHSGSLSEVAKKLKITTPAVHQKLRVAKMKIQKKKSRK